MSRTTYERPVLGALILTLILAVAAQAAVEVIAIRYRSAAELLPVVRTMLSADGKASADDRTNSLIIVDSEPAIARVLQFLTAIDAPSRQVTVRVRFQESREREERSAAAGVRVSGGGGSAAAGRAPRGSDGVNLQTQERTQRTSGGAEVFVSTLSGSWAFIRVGREIPFTPRWAEICRRHGRTATFQRMETGFEVKPILQDNLALVEIVPRISGMGSGGSPGEVRFTEAATQLQVPTGSWVSIGGAEQGAHEV
ncbi:MAG: hypothetical protein EHM15_05210, partial [Desulfobacteraceae bacterium]